MTTLEGNRMSVLVQSDKLDGAVGRVAHAIAKEEARPILAAVLLEGDENGLRVVAADNYRVAVADVAEGDCSAIGRVVIPRDELPILRAFLKVWKRPREVRLERHENGRSTLVASDDYRSVTLRLVDGTYPNYASLLAGGPRDRESIGVNPAFLWDAAKALPKGQAVAVRIPASREKIADGVLITAKGYTELIMPVRFAGPDSEPTGAEGTPS